MVDSIMNEVTLEGFECVLNDDIIDKWNMKYIFKFYAQKYKKKL